MGDLQPVSGLWVNVSPFFPGTSVTPFLEADITIARHICLFHAQRGFIQLMYAPDMPSLLCNTGLAIVDTSVVGHYHSALIETHRLFGAR